jgi:hypothetical protein
VIGRDLGLGAIGKNAQESSKHRVPATVAATNPLANCEARARVCRYLERRLDVIIVGGMVLFPSPGFDNRFLNVRFGFDIHTDQPEIP